MFKSLPRLPVIVAGIGALVLAAVVWWTASSSAPEPTGGRQGAGGQSVLVVTAPVEQRDFVDAIEAVGTAKANESVVLTAKVTETIGSLNFRDGEKVGAGAVIAELTSREQSADLAAARAELVEAERQHGRVTGLAGRGNATRAQLDTAIMGVDSAKARVAGLESRLSDRLIKTPFAGVLGLRQVSVGSLVKPGDVITTLDDISVIKLDFTVPETFLSSLSQGMTVKGRAAAYAGREFEGKVTAIDTRIDPLTRAIAIRAEVPNADDSLKPGMLLTVSLLKDQRKSLAVPETSLVPLQDKQFVYVVTSEGKADQREVAIGSRVPGFVEIKSGVAQGDLVITEGLLRVRQGVSVRVEQPKSASDDSARPGT